MSDLNVASFANDARLTSLAATIVGSDAFPFKATLFNKTAKANWLVAWHQDITLPIEMYIPGSGWKSPSTKAGVLFAQAPVKVLEGVVALRVQLDPSTSANGPLRVIDGSHTRGILSDTAIDDCVRDGVAVECLADVGSVIAMRPLIVHASSKITSDVPRRVLHIEYAASREFGGVRLAQA